MRSWILTLLGLLFSAAPWAQPTATIIGRVSDATGAVVSGADVTVRNTGTGLSRYCTHV